MPLILTLLASASLVGFAAALATGVFGGAFIPGAPSHLTLGTMAALLACTVHCAVFTYFLGTGLSIKEAVKTFELDEELSEETKLMKKKAFPWVFSAILTIMLAVLAGGFAMNGHLPGWLHGLIAMLAIVHSIFSFYKEFGAIRANVGLLAKLKKRLTARAAEAEWPMPSEAEISRIDQGKALVFFGVTTAFAFVYLRYITRTEATPLVPFALASAGAILLGALLLRGAGGGEETGERPRGESHDGA